MIIRVSDEFKQECKKNVSSLKYATLHIKEDNENITENDDLQEFKIEAQSYTSDKFIGSTVSKKVTVKIIDDGNYQLENKTISVKTGVEVGEIIEYQNLDSYIIPKPDVEEISADTALIGYDYMMKLETPYVDRVKYPIRTDDYLQDLCNQVGLTLGSRDFLNNDYMIQGNPFTNGESCRIVLSNIAQIALGIAVIDDEKLYIKNLDIVGEPIETIDGNNYMEFNPNNIFGPVNSFKIQMNNGVNGEESVREDVGVTDTNRCQITISDNYFLNSQEQRELIIDKMFNAIKGLTYLPVKIQYYGYPWLKLGDKIKVIDKNNNEYITYIMNHEFSYNGAYSGVIESKALSKTQSMYKNTSDIKTWKRKTELQVDKINGKITSIIDEQSQYEEKLTQIEQDVDSISQKVENTVDFKRESEGITELHITEAEQADVLLLEIKGSKTYNNYLYPSADLYPSEDLYPNMEVI